MKRTLLGIFLLAQVQVSLAVEEVTVKVAPGWVSILTVENSETTLPISLSPNELIYPFMFKAINDGTAVAITKDSNFKNVMETEYLHFRAGSNDYVAKLIPVNEEPDINVVVNVHE